MFKLTAWFAVGLALQHGCTQVATTQQGKKQPERVTERKMASENKESLAKRFEGTDPDTAVLIRDNGTEVTAVPAPFLHGGEVFLLKKFAKTRPIMLYIGLAGESVSVVLSGNPDAFIRLLAAAKADLSTRDAGVQAARAYLEWTRSSDERLKVVDSVQQIEPRPNLDENQLKAFEEFREKYAKVIEPPRCSGDNPVECDLYAVHSQDLVKIHLQIFADGRVKRTENVLEKNILIPYAL